MSAPSEKVQFKSGTTSSKIPRFDLIPRRALIRIAHRFALGQERHGDGAWNAGSSQDSLTDKEFIIARAAHVIDHAFKLIAKTQGVIPDDGDDDAGAIAWGGVFLCEAAEEAESRK